MSDAGTSTPARVQLVGRDNGAGLSRDMALLAAALRQLGVAVEVAALPHRGRLATWATRLRHAFGSPRFALQVQFERVRPEFFGAAARRVLIPNPEWFDAASRAALAGIDEVWTKTAHAARLFGALGVATRPLGFTSPDRLDASVPREAGFFHGPGRSGHKGTAALLALWAAHPHWPELTVAWRRKRVDVGTLPPNVRLIREHLDDSAYRRLQNRYRFHLCPSRTEGFGHYLVEAMSCGAVVVTLDAEPMNELVGADRGVLVRAHADGTQDLATLYAADPDALVEAIERCIGMSEARALALGAAARQAFETLRERFHGQLADALIAHGVAVNRSMGEGVIN